MRFPKKPYAAFRSLVQNQTIALNQLVHHSPPYVSYLGIRRKRMLRRNHLPRPLPKVKINRGGIFLEIIVEATLGATAGECVFLFNVWGVGLYIHVH